MYTSDSGYFRLFNGMGFLGGIIFLCILLLLLYDGSAFMTIFFLVVLFVLIKDFYLLFPYYFWALAYFWNNTRSSD